MKKFFCINLLIFINIFLYGQGEGNTTLVGRWAAGPPYAFKVENNIIYTASGGILLILDISDPTNPQFLGQVFTDGIINDVAKSGNYVYLAEKAHGLKIIDVSNLSNPIQVGELQLSVPVNKITSNNQALFVAEGGYDEGQWRGGLRTLDISDPLNPRILGFCELPKESHYISLVGDYIYIDNYFDEFLIINISDLSNPILARSFDTRFGNSYLSGNFLYVASRGEGLKIFDVTNPLYPSFIKLTVFLGGAEDVVVVDNHAYVTNGDYSDGNNWREGQVRVFNISNPRDPLEIGLYESPGNVSQLSKSGNNLIISEGTVSYSFSREDGSGLRFLNIIDPSQPQPINFYPTPGWGESVVVRNSYAFVLTRFGGMSVVDLQHISEPIQIGYYNSPGSPEQVVLQNDYAYLADGDGGLRVIDISDLSSPVETGSFEIDGFAFKVAVNKDYAYVLSYSGRLYILDISDPSDILEVNAIEVNSTPLSVLVDGNLLYLSEGVSNHWGASGSIKIFDVTNPINPIQIGEYYSGWGLYEFLFNPTDIALQGSYLYVANKEGSLKILGVSDPTNPVVISDVPTFAENIEVEGNFAYLTRFDGELKIFDISNPFDPKEISLFNSQFYITDIDVDDGKIYASAFDYGMMILRNDLATDNEEHETIPMEYTLKQNYPNPFNPTTTIEFSIPTPPISLPLLRGGTEGGVVTLKVYDVLGKEVAVLVNGVLNGGKHEVTFNASELASGIYFYTLKAGEFTQTNKMILLK